MSSPTTTSIRRAALHPAKSINRLLGGLFIRAYIARGSHIVGIDHLSSAWDAQRGGRPLVLICNHLSYIDSHVIEQLLAMHGFKDLAHRLYHIAGQKTYETIWRLFFTTGVNTIKVLQAGAGESPAQQRRQAIESFRAFKQAVSMNPVLIFPEGTRSRTGRMGSGVPTLVNYLRRNLVLPMGLQGTEKMLGVGAAFPRRTRVVLRVGAPFIAHARPEADKTQEISDYLLRVAELLDPAYRPS